VSDTQLELEMADLIIGVGCRCHDIQNSLKWALASTGIPQDLKDLHVVVESLRNSFSLLLQYLPAFLESSLAFRHSSVSTDVVEAFWRDLGVDADMVELFGEVNPQWGGNQLWVNQDLAGQDDVIRKVSHCMIYLCKWRHFNDSRWCTKGRPAEP
jgi:hypothetical protein